VLIPRPNTELLVEAALARIPKHATWRIADIGTGSGNIAITIALERPHARPVATDVSKRALALAKKNAARHGVEKRIRFMHGNLLAPLARMKTDIIIANLPYLKAERALNTAAERATRFEPALAKHGVRTNRSGTLLLERFFLQLHTYKKPPRLILLEVGHEQYRTMQQWASRHAPAYHWTLVPKAGGHIHALIGTR
ncbi:MAG: tRNA (adenine(22)-N(1))-methyltransferase TrmK, partial [Sideroxyarcus sp.]|nr:tRNA (adenine(22)-N(1))-methyltransferase TrmK [Sideroxyarcus sp.]